MLSTKLDDGPVAISDRWILEVRPSKNTVNPRRPYACFVEEELAATGEVEEVATVFLTNRECSFRCLMCDLWKNTTDARVPDGSIPQQISWALQHLPRVQHIKLYNSGNFFDSQAIPRADLPRIAELVGTFETVVIENHPNLVDERCLAFQDQLTGRLEVAMGLETVHGEVLERLNKRMTVSDFERAVRFLVKHQIAVRAFILLRTPFQSEDEGVHWAKESIRQALDMGVDCCVVIPTRGGNGALERLRDRGLFATPRLSSLEEVTEFGVSLRGGRVFVDLWDIDKLKKCDRCHSARVDRLRSINLTQSVPDSILCDGAAHL